MAKKNQRHEEKKIPKQKIRNPKPETRNLKWWAKDSGAFLLIALTTFILYFNTVQFDYAQDDAIVITENMYTQQGAKGISDLLTHDTFFGFFKVEKNLVAGGRYRPLSLVTFALEKEWFGEAPHTSHLINLLLYALCGIFIYLMLKQLFKNAQEKYARMQLLPLIATLLFIAHPMHTEAVANIKGRDEIMSMLFCSLGSWLLLQYMDSGKSFLKMLLSFVCFFLAMLSKENGVTFFLVVPLMWWLFRKAEMKSFVRLMIPIGAATGLFLFLRQLYTHTALDKEVNEIMNNPFFGMSVREKYATIFYTFGKYLWLLLFPLKLTSDYYPFEVTAQSFSSVPVLIMLAIIAFAIFLIVKMWKREPIIAFSILFFGLTFSVFSNLVFPVGTFMSERFVFMPSLGFCLLVAFGIYRLSDLLLKRETVTSNLPLAKSALALLSFIMLAYTVRAITRNPVWENDYMLFTNDVLISPSSAKANNAAGGVLIDYADREPDPAKKKQMTDQAKVYLKKALSLYPKYSNAYLLLGNAYLKGDKDYPSAFYYYKEGMLIYPGYTLAYKNMKVLMSNWKDFNAQRDSISVYIQQSPRDPVPYYFMGSLFENQNKPVSALAQYKKSLQLTPNFAEALLQTGMIYGKYFNRLDSSIFYLEKSIAANPDIQESYENLGTAYGMNLNLPAAINILNEGIKRFPNDSKLYYNLGVSYQIGGNKIKADECMAKAKQLEQAIKK